MFVFLMQSIALAKAEIPSYQLDQDKHLVVNYLYQLPSEPQQNSLNEIIDLTGNEWQNTHLTNGDLLIMPGKNWFAFELINNSKEVKKSYLEMANQIRMHSVGLFVRDRHENIDKKNMQLQRSNNRSVMVTIEPYSQVTLYLTIESSIQLRSSLMVYSAKAYIETTNASQFLQGISIGGLLCLSFAYILLFFATGNKSSFILSGYFLSNMLMLSAMLGLNLYYFFPYLPELVGTELPLLTAISTIFLLMFTDQLFNLKVKFNNIYHVIRISFWGLLLYMPLSIQLSVVDNLSISMGIYVLTVFSLTVLAVYLHKNSIRLALLFAFVMAAHLVLALIVIISLHWLDTGFIAYRNLFYGVIFWLNCLLVTFILSRQYHYQLLEKQAAQREALTNAIASERTKEELLKLQSQSQEELENSVQERTLELNIALQELEEANHELEQKNTLDELTGLFNRRFYDQKILAEYRRSKRNLTPLSLVLIDIDHFKAVNDTYGHLAGDHCLAWLSEQIKQSLKRSSDMAFRYGGEEFCLILADTDGKGAVALAENLRKRIAKEAFIYKEISIPLTISNGIFTYLQQDNVMPEQIFASADKALYQAKHDGRNQTQESFGSLE